MSETIKDESTCRKSLQVGNAAKMREALEKCDALLQRITKSAFFLDANMGLTIDTMNVGNAITEALSAPPRNCDVGTVEQQRERFRKFCFQRLCNNCPMYSKESYSECGLMWMQMPYESEEK